MFTFPTKLNVKNAEVHYSDGSEVDLRKEIKYILNNYGFHALIRRNSKIHCSCFDSLYNDGSIKCPYCGGTGRVNRVERHLVRRDYAVMDRSFQRNTTEAEFGRIVGTLYKFYMQHYVNPLVQDLIYYVTWCGDNPKTLVSEFEIQSIDPLRADNGRIEFWKCICKEKVVGKQIKQCVVRNMEGIDMSSEDASYQYDLLW